MTAPTYSNPLVPSLLLRDDLHNLPQRAERVVRTLEQGTLAMLIGPWSSGKTFVELDLAACVATGTPWHGRRVEQGRVLMIAAEGVSGINDRLCAWEAHNNREIDGADLIVLPRAVNLLHTTEVDHLVHLVTAHDPALILIDTLARCTTGGDLNSSQDMSKAVDACRRLLQAAPRATVLIAHHTGKDTRTPLGSVVLEAAADTVYRIKKSGDEVTLTCSKRRDGSVEDTIKLELSRVDGTGSAALNRRGHSTTLTPRANDLMSAVSAHVRPGERTSKADLRKASGQSPATFTRSLNTLVEAGLITAHGTGRTAEYALADN